MKIHPKDLEIGGGHITHSGAAKPGPGRPRTSTLERCTFSLEPCLWRLFRALAKRKGWTQADLLRHLISEATK